MRGGGVTTRAVNRGVETITGGAALACFHGDLSGVNRAVDVQSNSVLHIF